MNNKEFVDELASELRLDPSEVQQSISALGKAVVGMLNDETVLTLKGFGTFEVRKRLERVAMNPATRQKVLVPPKLVMAFRPSPSLKEKF